MFPLFFIIMIIVWVFFFLSFLLLLFILPCFDYYPSCVAPFRKKKRGTVRPVLHVFSNTLRSCATLSLCFSSSVLIRRLITKKKGKTKINRQHDHLDGLVYSRAKCSYSSPKSLYSVSVCGFFLMDFS